MMLRTTRLYTRRDRGLKPRRIAVTVGKTLMTLVTSLLT